MSNPIENLKLLIGKNETPQQITQQLLSNTPNPIFNNLIKMAQSGDSKGVENFARNICKERGKDFDKEFSEFMSNFK
jgi:predicted secreted protein